MKNNTKKKKKNKFCLIDAKDVIKAMQHEIELLHSMIKIQDKKIEMLKEILIKM